MLTAINNAGIAVGFYNQGAAGSTNYSFSFDTISGGGCKNLPCSNCVALGINDAGWIVGRLGLQAFVYKNGTIVPFSYPGAQETDISGIDGQGRIAGTYSPDEISFYGFTGDASTGVITTGPVFSCPTSGTNTNTGGTNSNGQVAGDHSGPPGFFVDANGACALLSAGSAYGLNDAAQIVGTVDPSFTQDYVLLPPH